MSDDLISRKAAIAKFEPWLKVDGYSEGELNMLKAVLYELTVMPSAEPEQQWIPCSERLPVIGEHYVSEPCIVYCSNGAYCFSVLEENFFGQVGWNCERDDEYHEPLGEVIAWMPLPEPYKEGGTDD